MPYIVSVGLPLLQLAVVVEVVVQCLPATVEARKRVTMLGKRIEGCMTAGLCDGRRERGRYLEVLAGRESDCLRNVWPKLGERLFICKICESSTR